jgi:xylulokinase
MDVLLGLDVGTSNLKAVAYDPASGSVAAQASEPTPQAHPRPEWTEYDALLMWQRLAACIRRVAASLSPGQRIAAVSAASMGEAGVALDRNGEPLYPIIAWHDPRSEPQARFLRREVGPERLHQITGQQARHVFAAAKLLWLREHAPSVIEQMALWLSMEDYVLWRLSGVAATDYTMASRTMLFDQQAADWSPPMMDICGVSADVLPRPWPSGTVIGKVTDQAVRATGLAAGTPVATGGHDHLCGALAVGAVETGRFLDSSGTAQSMLMPIDRFHGGGDVFQAGFSCYRHVLRGRYLIQGGLNTAGAALEWVVKLGGGGADAYDALFRAAEQSGPGARGVFCLPHFRGSTTPINDAESRAAFIGLSLAHERGDLMRAVVEGLAYYLRENLERMAQVGPAAEGHMLAIGGANRHPLVLQVKADVCNRPVLAAAVPEAVSVGAALLAGLAIGMFKDEAQAAATVACDFQRYEPGAQRAQMYDRWYNETYVRMYPALRQLRE